MLCVGDFWLQLAIAQFLESKTCLKKASGFIVTQPQLAQSISALAARLRCQEAKSNRCENLAMLATSELLPGMPGLLMLHRAKALLTHVPKFSVFQSLLP